MDRDEILAILSRQSAKERPQTVKLREQARTIVSTQAEDDGAKNFPTVLLDLLSQIIKPLFTTTQHPSLTSTGRKVLVAPPPPSIAGRFLNDLLQDEEVSKPWKTPFTVPLLQYILHGYHLLPFESPRELSRKNTIEEHFHLLVPPILNMIDDASPTPWKSSGCHLLSLLCQILVSTQSEMLKKSGLADVFIDALKTSFLLLPTLTAEEESLQLLEELYPAFLGVVDARFVKMRSIQAGIWLGEKTDSSLTWAMGEEYMRYDAMLTLVFRHGIMASLTHLSSSSGLSNTSSVALTTFLLRQIPPVFDRMSVHCVKHLQTLLPMLRMGLMDPFVLVAPEMVLAMLDANDCVIRIGEVRVREKWWMEILRAVVGCWLNCVDEKTGSEKKVAKVARNVAEFNANDRLANVMARLKMTAKMLGEVVGKEEWENATKRLTGEEDELKGLFAA